MKQTKWVMLVAVGLLACEGGSFKKKNCKSCETVTSGPQGPTNKIVNKVCGDDEVAAYLTANNSTNSSLTVVTTCK